MSKAKKGIAILCGMVLAVSLLLPVVVMKVKASETAKANLTINFVASIDSTSEYSLLKEGVTINNLVNNGDGTYSGTIDLANESITYEKESGDTRYIVAWYNSEMTPISPTYSFENLSLSDSNNDGVFEITLYAVYGETIQINFNNNASYLGAGTTATVSQYYPQSTVDETSKTITLPSDPKSELGESFMIDGYTFKGWGAQESGETEMVSSATINCGDSKIYYAYWEKVMSSGTFSESGEYNLEPNTQYTLGDGTWTVNGGATKYPGGTVFYVKTAGTYTLSKQ